MFEVQHRAVLIIRQLYRVRFREESVELLSMNTLFITTSVSGSVLVPHSGRHSSASTPKI